MTTKPKTRKAKRTKQANRAGERPQSYDTASGERRWRARYSIPAHLSPTGRRQQRLVIGRTAEEVQAKISAKLAEVRAGRVADDRMTFAAFASTWSSTILPGENLAPKTVKTYRDMLRLYVVPAIGHRTLSGHNAVSVGDVEQMLADMRTRGLGVRTQLYARVVASKVLHAAQRRDLVTRNVARLATAPRDGGQAKPQKALSRQETAAVLAAVTGTRWYPLTFLGFATGLRPGELLALHWGDVDVDGPQPMLTVRYSLSHATGRPTIKAPKRERSYRTVPLPPEAVAVLRTWRKTQAQERLACDLGVWPTDGPFADLVFTNPYGKPYRDTTYRDALNKRTGGDTGVPKCHPHQCRHTYATHLLEAGAPIHHVAELLGDTVGTVEGAYAHVMRPKHEVAALVSSLLG